MLTLVIFSQFTCVFRSSSGKALADVSRNLTRCGDAVARGAHGHACLSVSEHCRRPGDPVNHLGHDLHVGVQGRTYSLHITKVIAPRVTGSEGYGKREIVGCLCAGEVKETRGLREIPAADQASDLIRA